MEIVCKTYPFSF